MSGQFEERLTRLGAEVVYFKLKVENDSSFRPWWEKLLVHLQMTLPMMKL